jgi:hypothetical protein
LVDRLSGDVEVERVLVMDGAKYGVSGLHGEESDRIIRGICPDCGDWNNWTSEGLLNTCNGCRFVYYYAQDGFQKVLGPVGASGTLIPGQEYGPVVPKEKTPMEELLLAVTPDNKAHWIQKFSKFEEGKFNPSWNWPSFFLGPLRYFVKGLWQRGLAYGLGAGLVTVSMARVFSEGVLLWHLAGSIFFGVMGSNDYYRFCLKYQGNIPGARKARLIGMICFWLLVLSPVILPVLLSMSL